VLGIPEEVRVRHPAVEERDLVAAIHGRRRQVAPDEAGAADDEDAHRRHDGTDATPQLQVGRTT
jgi:hypothetical protein